MACRALLDRPSDGDVVSCLTAQHACAVERLLGFSVPRAGELPGFGGWDTTNDLACLGTAAVGGVTGIGSEKAKALRKCDRTLQKAAAMLGTGRLKRGQTCAAAVFTCLQTKPGDADCLAKASGKCTSTLAAVPALATAFTTTVAKACGAPLTLGDLRAAEGLGLATRDAACAAHGVPALATVDDVTSCFARELACRVDQLLTHQTPRFGELLDAAGVTVP